MSVDGPIHIRPRRPRAERRRERAILELIDQRIRVKSADLDVYADLAQLALRSSPRRVWSGVPCTDRLMLKPFGWPPAQQLLAFATIALETILADRRFERRLVDG